MIRLSNDKKRDKGIKKCMIITTIIFMVFSLLLDVLLGITIPALLFTLICVPCIGVLSGAFLYIAMHYIKHLFEDEL